MSLKERTVYTVQHINRNLDSNSYDIESCDLMTETGEIVHMPFFELKEQLLSDNILLRNYKLLEKNGKDYLVIAIFIKLYRTRFSTFSHSTFDRMYKYWMIKNRIYHVRIPIHEKRASYIKRYKRFNRNDLELDFLVYLADSIDAGKCPLYLGCKYRDFEYYMNHIYQEFLINLEEHYARNPSYIEDL